MDFAAIKNLLTNFANGINQVFGGTPDKGLPRIYQEAQYPDRQQVTTGLVTDEAGNVVGRMANPSQSTVSPSAQAIMDNGGSSRLMRKADLLAELEAEANDDTASGGLEEFARRMAAAGGKSTLSTASGESSGQRIADYINEKNEAAIKEETDDSTDEYTGEDIVTYTYKPGDTFGQVIMNLGLMTDKGLWGPGGDVEYYTQQLIDQDMLDERGNVKLNVPFKLRRRKD